MSVVYPTTNSAQRLGALRSWRWRGSLQELPHLAIEIQLKVYAYLDPRDLLVLARTCKQFRAFLLHRSNESLWRAARENAVGNLPPCPPFMSEPAFLNLLFSTYCQNCGNSPVWKAMWAWFARYCPKCVIALSYYYYEAKEKIVDVDRHEAFSTSGALLELFGVYKNQGVDRFNDYSANVAFLLHKTHIDSFIRDLDQLAKPITDEARSQLIERQKAYIAGQLPYVNACRDWHNERQKERADRFEAKRREHFTEIIKRLTESGWDQEVEMIQRDRRKIESLQVVRQPSRLRPKSWEKAFKAIYPILWPHRHKRLVKEGAAVFRVRFAVLQAAILAHYIQLPRTAQMDYHPDSVDLALMEECRATADVPADQTVTQEDFARIVPALAARWEQERKKELTEAVIARLPERPPDGVDVLGLGIAIFPCTHCKFAEHSQSPQTRDVFELRIGYYPCSHCKFPRHSQSRPHAFYRYPAILGHPCMRLKDNYGFDSTHNKNMEVYPTLTTMRPMEPEEAENDQRWFPFALSPVDLDATVRFLWVIMQAMRLDPSRTTGEELQASPARLRCLWCHSVRTRYASERNGVMPPAGMSNIYSWEAALHHSFFHIHQWDPRYYDPTGMWEVANTSAACEPEGVLSLLTPDAVWACSLCVQWDDRGDNMKVHLMEKHGIEYSDDCIKDGTIYVHQSKSTVPFMLRRTADGNK